MDRRAINQLHSIQRSILRKSPTGAQRIGVRIVTRVADHAALTPFGSPLERGGPARVLVVTRTRYVVVYHVVGDEFRVLTVQHTAQRR